MRKFILTFVAWALYLGFAYSQLTYIQVTNGLTDVFEGGSMQFNIGDIDNDGDLDIVSVGDHSSPLIPAEHGIMVFKNNGNGTAWTKVMNGDFGYGGVALGDVNNDGFMDVAYGMHHNYSGSDFGNQVLEVALGDGTGNNWVPYDDFLGQQGQNWGMEGCDFGDIDNDGLLDLGANSFGCCDGVWLYRNVGDGTWENIGGSLNLNSTGQFRFGDFNRDGKLDFVANNTQYNGQPYQIWQNTGNNQFVPMQTGIPFSDDYFYFDIADVNNDGAPDLGLIYYGVPFVYTFDVISNSWVSISNGLPTTSQNLWNMAMGDLDGDGFIDLVTEKTGLITLYKGDGQGNWTQAATLPIAEGICRDIKLADFDHNGFADIAYWAEISNTAFLRVYLNTALNTEQWIRPVTPQGGEFYCHGSVQFIKWTSGLPAGNTGTVTLELSTTGAAGPYNILASGVPNSGTYQWIVPAVSSTDCYLRYTLISGSNTVTATDQLPFTIDTCGGAYIIPGPMIGNAEICANSNQTYMVPLLVNNTGYTWTLPNGWTGSSTTNTINVTSGTQGGVISVVAHFANGSSAPLSLYVTVHTVDTTVVLNGITLTAQQDSATYQWIDCTSGQPISGATNQSYTPGQNGNYAVILNSETCVDTSDCYQVVVTGMSNDEAGRQLMISPMPVGDHVWLAFPEIMESIELYSLTGILLLQQLPFDRQSTLDVSGIPAGMYFLRVSGNNHQVCSRILKL